MRYDKNLIFYDKYNKILCIFSVLSKMDNSFNYYVTN